ncbi:NHLP bacteriocin system secretion protein [Cysteiniphilum halobium]|uniref:NHLP bacteriocin system secretion protein n=1 Tax=Cysteiniphilum halobium TaxID=2219059 RepID=UPI003F876063
MQQVKIIKLSYWIWFLLIILPFIALILWAIFGVVYTDARGQVVILPSPNRVQLITAKYSGVVSDIKIKIADQVTKGQILAIIDQNSLKMRIESSKSLLKDLEQEKKELEYQYHKFLTDTKEYTILAKDLSEQKISDLNKQKDYFEYLNKSKRDLYEQKLITFPQFLQTETELFRILEGYYNARDQYNSVLLNNESIRVNWIERLSDISTQINNNKLSVRLLEHQYDDAHYIRSNMDGVVDQILVPIGQNIQPAQSLISLSSDGKASYAVAFMPVNQGKRIQIGAKAYVAAGTVSKDIYGYIVGKVVRIEEYQSSTQAINAILIDNSLAMQLEQENLNFVVWVALDKDPMTISGLKWTSINGPPYIITPGTLGTINVVIAKQHPIELILPFLRSLFSIGDPTS